MALGWGQRLSHKEQLKDRAMSVGAGFHSPTVAEVYGVPVTS